MRKKISFIGLGKLGLPLASCFAEAGHQIIGIDKSDYFIESLSKNKLPFFEPGLDRIFPNKNFVSFTTSYQNICEETDCTIILVNTQDEKGGYTTATIEAVITEFAELFADTKKNYHLIILSSTVLPGTIKLLINLIEKISMKKINKDFGLVYIPDFVKLGSVIEDFKNPEFFIIGANSEKDLEISGEIWKTIHENDPPFRPLTLEEAEIAKITLNAYIVSKISFANFLGQICDGIENVNVHNITNSIGLDKRISRHYFGAGAPYGGTCFPRDTTAFIKFAEQRKRNAKNILFAEEVNIMVFNSIYEKLKDAKNILILGLSFKKDTPVTIGSPTVEIIRELEIDKKKFVHCHDFISETFENSLRFNKISVEKCFDVQLGINAADVVLIMHDDVRYSKYEYKGKNVIDVWGILNKKLTHG